MEIIEKNAQKKGIVENLWQASCGSAVVLPDMETNKLWWREHVDRQ